MEQLTNPQSAILRVLLHDDRRITRAIKYLVRAHNMLRGCLYLSPEIKDIRDDILKSVFSGCHIIETYTEIIVSGVITDPARLLPDYGPTDDEIIEEWCQSVFRICYEMQDAESKLNDICLYGAAAHKARCLIYDRKEQWELDTLSKTFSAFRAFKDAIKKAADLSFDLHNALWPIYWGGFPDPDDAEKEKSDSDDDLPF